MREEQDKDILKGFFAAYFHEDWACDANTTDEVVLRYKREMPHAQVRAVADGILVHISRFHSDKTLEDSLFYELGCYYMPSGDGKTAREWLRGVAALLLDGSSPQVE